MQRLVSVKRALTSASGSRMVSYLDMGKWESISHTFGFVELGVESEADLRGAHAHQLILVVLR